MPTFAFSPVALPRRSLHQGVHALVARPTDAPSGVRKEALSVSWVRHQDEVREAQRLRYRVFALEMGAALPQTVSGHDIDLFDDYCEHLLVRDADSHQVIGTYRVLGANVLGAPAWDPDFNSADLPMMMRIADLPKRYLRHFSANASGRQMERGQDRQT